jgi:DNA-binding transcriptional MerR regulator
MCTGNEALIMKAKKYLIGDLADKAGVTVRTIRYYTEKGLLPEPDRPGKYAYYTTEHLERLELILKLKELRLPLWEIEHVLNTGDSAELQKLLNQVEEPQSLSIQMDRVRLSPPGPGESALDYISTLMGNQQILNEKRPYPQQAKPVSRPSAPQTASTSRWIRVEISPEIEIHFRQPLKPDQQKRLDQLLASASQIFSQ